MDGLTDERYEIVLNLKQYQVRKKSCTQQMTTSWRETHLPTILSRYKLEDIFNADEFGPCFEQYLTKFWN